MQPRRFGSRLPGKQTNTTPTSKLTRTSQGSGKPSGNKLKLAMLALIPVMIIALVIIIANKPKPIKVKTIDCPLCQHKIERPPEEVKDAAIIRCDACNKEFVVDAKKAHRQANEYLYKGDRLHLQGLEASDAAQQQKLFGEASAKLEKAIELYNLIEEAGFETTIRYDKQKAVNIRISIRKHRVRR